MENDSIVEQINKELRLITESLFNMHDNVAQNAQKVNLMRVLFEKHYQHLKSWHYFLYHGKMMSKKEDNKFQFEESLN